MAQAREYRLISADSHLTEPGDLWTSRVAAKYKERVPRIDRFEQGDAWIMEGVPQPVSFGFTACAGMDPEDMTDWIRFEDLRRGGYDPAARCAETDWARPRGKQGPWTAGQNDAQRRSFVPSWHARV